MSRAEDDRRLDKSQEFRKAFDKLPNVLIQDPARACWYFIPAERLVDYEVNANTWSLVDAATVTFVIPDGDFVEEIPPFLAPGETMPSVLIQYRKEESAYFLAHHQLETFSVPWESDVPVADTISFIIPIGHELIEELPELRRAMLQSNTTITS